MQHRAVIVGLALISSAIGMAQSFEEKVADLSLLQSKEIQTELGIQESLRAKMNAFADEFNAKANKLQEDYQKSAQGKNPPPPAPLEKLAQLESNLKKNVFKLLTKQQMKRLSEVTLQAAGYPAMLNPTVAKEIGLSDAQLKKLRDAYEATGKEVNRIQEGAIKPIYDKYGKEQPKDEAAAKVIQEKINAEAKAAMDKITPQLTKLRDGWLLTMKKTVKAIQINKFDALQGKPFKPK